MDIFGCPKLDRLPENLGNAESLEELDLSKTAIRKVPSSIGLLKKLLKAYISVDVRGYHHHLIQCQEVLIPWTCYCLLYLYQVHACSLTRLDLRDCNLNNIGSIFSLEYLGLSGNDFVCLTESNIWLSKLKCVVLDNCTSLCSLSKLPLNIEIIYAEGWISLEKLPDQLKPNNSLEPFLYLKNCFKLADNESSINRLFQGLNSPLGSWGMKWNVRLLFQEVKFRSGLATKAWGLK